MTAPESREEPEYRVEDDPDSLPWAPMSAVIVERILTDCPPLSRIENMANAIVSLSEQGRDVDGWQARELATTIRDAVPELERFLFLYLAGVDRRV